MLYVDVFCDTACDVLEGTGFPSRRRDRAQFCQSSASISLVFVHKVIAARSYHCEEVLYKVHAGYKLRFNKRTKTAFQGVNYLIFELSAAEKSTVKDIVILLTLPCLEPLWKMKRKDAMKQRD